MNVGNENEPPDAQCIPEELAPRMMTRNGPVFHNLQHQLLRGHTKMFLCHQLIQCARGEPFKLEPTSFQNDGTGVIHIKAVAERYHLNFHTLKSWIKAVKSGFVLQDTQSTNSAPSVLDAQAKEMIRQEVHERDRQHLNPLSELQLSELMRVEKANTLKRRGHNVNENDVKDVAYGTVKRIKTELGIKIRVAQSLTEARMKALLDRRMFLKSACMYYAFARYLPAVYKYNCDCTTVTVGSGMHNVKFAVLGDDHKRGEQVTSTSLPSQLDILIKIFALGNAHGDLGPMVLIVAVGGMDDNEFYHSMVAGVCHTNLDMVGHIYFCKTKCGCGAMWRHWFLNVCIPFIKEKNEKYDDVLKDFNGDCFRAFLVSDGEAVILNEVFHEEVLQAFRDACIDYMKDGAAMTSRTQDFDVGKMFVGLKTNIRGMEKRCEVAFCPILEANLKKFIREFQATYPSVTLSSEFTTKFRNGVQTIVAAAAKSWNPHTLAESFVVTGHHTKMANELGEHVDFEKTMSRCMDQSCTDVEKAHMLDCRDAIVEQMLRHGCCTNAFLDELGVAVCPGAVNRDDLVLMRRDAELITHIESVARMALYQRNRQLRNDPELLAAQKLLEQEQRAQQAAQQKATKAAEKQQHKQDELTRRATLTQEERHAEDAAVKAAKIASKEAVAAAKAQVIIQREAAVQAAQELLQAAQQVV